MINLNFLKIKYFGIGGDGWVQWRQNKGTSVAQVIDNLGVLD